MLAIFFFCAQIYFNIIYLCIYLLMPILFFRILCVTKLLPPKILFVPTYFLQNLNCAWILFAECCFCLNTVWQNFVSHKVNTTPESPHHLSYIYFQVHRSSTSIQATFATTWWLEHPMMHPWKQWFSPHVSVNCYMCIYIIYIYNLYI